MRRIKRRQLNLAISDDDFEDIKRRLQTDNVKIQFGVGNMEQAKTYIGKLGEPIVVEDRGVFAICDGKSSENRKYYPMSKGMPPVLDDTLDAYIEDLIERCLDNTYPGFLTCEFAQEGSHLNRSKLIEAFEATKKFCLPDGRSLPEGCFVREKFGIYSAPNLSGRFLRHHDRNGSYDSVRSIGDTQSDSFARHDHYINRDNIDFDGRLIRGFSRLYKSGDWSGGTYKFVYDLVLGDYISKYNFPNWTEYTGDSETRPKNLTYLSFYRYDW
ncbi:hypothetical protein A0V01_06020 (plasmid) [Borrelia hermsii]|uniref:Uncharacterized protein n=2 Tax=Borrelia hermsii TaxID=140 RepID=A0AAN0X6L3_BORHE|nr:hypothetical protein A0V01_06020 [Borrelia hermsii]UPA08660.1 hypothetical protein bhDAH_001386 [Borrelia hermsii DAH]